MWYMAHYLYSGYTCAILLHGNIIIVETKWKPQITELLFLL